MIEGIDSGQKGRWDSMTRPTLPQTVIGYSPT